MVLVVDDHADTRRALMMMLKLEGFTAHAVASGQEALDYLLNHPLPHCILLDYRMPGLDGMDVLRAIRADRRYDGIHVLLFSGECAEVAEQALAAGAQAFVQKASLDWAQLQRVLREFCTPRQKPEPQGAPKTERSVG